MIASQCTRSSWQAETVVAHAQSKLKLPQKPKSFCHLPHTDETIEKLNKYKRYTSKGKVTALANDVAS